MKKTLSILCLILIVLLFVQAGAFIKDLQDQDKTIAHLQSQINAITPTLEASYTMITNLSAVMYVNRVVVDMDEAIYWTDTNGISGFDVTIGTTHYRYVEGHVEMPQLSLYVPYLFVDEDALE